MSKFEVGQRVKVVADNLDDDKTLIGLEGTVLRPDSGGSDFLVGLDQKRESYWFDNDELEEVE